MQAWVSCSGDGQPLVIRTRSAALSVVSSVDPTESTSAQTAHDHVLFTPPKKHIKRRPRFVGR